MQQELTHEQKKDLIRRYIHNIDEIEENVFKILEQSYNSGYSKGFLDAKNSNPQDYL